MTLRRYSGVAMTSIDSSSGIVDEVVLDQVGARPAHRVLVAVERLVERRRVVGLDALDDGRARRRRGRARGAAARRALEVAAQLLPADLEDRVGVEVVERAAAGAARRSARGPAASRRSPSRASSSTQAPCASSAALAPAMARSRWRELAGARGRPRPPRGPRRTGAAGPSRSRWSTFCHDADLRPDGRGSATASRKAGAASSRSAIRASRSASGAAPRANSAEDRVAELAGGGRSPLPAADLVRSGTGRGGGCGARGRARTGPPAESSAGSSASTAARCARSAAISARTASRLGVAQAVVEVVDAEVRREHRVVGEHAAGPAPRRGRRTASSSGPASGAGAGTRQVGRWQQRRSLGPPAPPAGARARPGGGGQAARGRRLAGRARARSRAGRPPTVVDDPVDVGAP